jgi:hypothetical protein
MVQYPTTVDRAFAALADPTRRAVLERLGSASRRTHERKPMNPTTVTTPDELEIRMERIFDAPRAHVFSV